MREAGIFLKKKKIIDNFENSYKVKYWTNFNIY